MFVTKLKNDAIIEVIFEMRFSSSEIPEIVVGRLADNPRWQEFRKSQLPNSEIPAPIRRAEASLMFQPIIQLEAQDRSRIVRIGEFVISYHVVGDYCGWSALKNELADLVNWAFSKLSYLNVQRIGLRYLDALRSDVHGIENPERISLEIKVAGSKVKDQFLLTFMEHFERDVDAITRITPAGLVKGEIPENTTTVTDIDTYTPDGYVFDEAGAILEWTDRSHSINKAAFFRLIPDGILESLLEK